MRFTNAWSLHGVILTARRELLLSAIPLRSLRAATRGCLRSELPMIAALRLSRGGAFVCWIIAQYPCGKNARSGSVRLLAQAWLLIARQGPAMDTVPSADGIHVDTR